MKLNLIVMLVFCAATIAVYWFYIRPELAKHPRLAEAYKYADSFWAKAAARLRMWWDLLVAQLFIVGPTLFDAVQTGLGSVDPTLIPEGWRFAFQMLGVFIIVFKALIIRRTAETVDGPK